MHKKKAAQQTNFPIIIGALKNSKTTKLFLKEKLNVKKK